MNIDVLGNSGNGHPPLLRTDPLYAAFFLSSKRLMFRRHLWWSIFLLSLLAKAPQMASSNATTGLEKPPAPSYATISASKLAPVAITTEADEEFDAFLEENPGKLFACYVTYPSSYSPMQDSIVEGIRDTITKNNSKFLDEGLFWSEFKGGTPARRDVHRILVAFTHEEDQAAFRSLMQVMFKDPQGVWLHAQIGQERLSYEDILGSSGDKGQKVYMVLKKMLDSFTVNQIEKFFTGFVWKAKGFTHPFLGSIDKITWFWHKSGVRRRMFIAEVTPHKEDLQCKELPSIISPRPGHIAPFVIGCSLHECGLCKQKGHREEVHDSFRGRGRTNAKRGAEANSLEPGSKIREQSFLLTRSSLFVFLLLSCADFHIRFCPCFLCCLLLSQVVLLISFHAALMRFQICPCSAALIFHSWSCSICCLLCCAPATIDLHENWLRLHLSHFGFAKFQQTLPHHVATSAGKPVGFAPRLAIRGSAPEPPVSSSLSFGTLCLIDLKFLLSFLLLSLISLSFSQRSPSSCKQSTTTSTLSSCLRTTRGRRGNALSASSRAKASSAATATSAATPTSRLFLTRPSVRCSRRRRLMTWLRLRWRLPRWLGTKVLLPRWPGANRGANPLSSCFEVSLTILVQT